MTADDLSVKERDALKMECERMRLALEEALRCRYISQCQECPKRIKKALKK